MYESTIISSNVVNKEYSPIDTLDFGHAYIHSLKTKGIPYSHGMTQSPNVGPTLLHKGGIGLMM